MANVTESSVWESGIYRIETTDPILGGETGTANIQAKQLANRTLYLKARADQVDAAASGYGSLQARLAVLQNSVEAISVDPSGAQALALVAEHEVKADPHPQYQMRRASDGLFVNTADFGGLSQPALLGEAEHNVCGLALDLAGAFLGLGRIGHGCGPVCASNFDRAKAPWRRSGGTVMILALSGPTRM